MARSVCHRRDQRDGCSTAANHNDFLTRIIDILWPLLRMNNLAFERINTYKVRRITLIIAIITSATIDKVTCDYGSFLSMHFNRQTPSS